MFFEPNKKFGIVAITNGCRNCVDEQWENVLLKEVTNLLYDTMIRE
jgi:hypothetical protein